MEEKDIIKALNNGMKEISIKIDGMRKEYRVEYKKDKELNKYLEGKDHNKKLLKIHSRLETLKNFRMVNVIGKRSSYEVLNIVDNEIANYLEHGVGALKDVRLNID